MVEEKTEPLRRRSCKAMEGADGERLGYVCVMPQKDLEKNDIIFDPTGEEARSMRSTTELINTLKKREVPEESVIETLEFVSERLRALKLEESSKSLKVGSAGMESSSKKEV